MALTVGVVGREGEGDECCSLFCTEELNVWNRASSCWSRGNSAGAEEAMGLVSATVSVAMVVKSRKRSLHSLICHHRGEYHQQSCSTRYPISLS